MSDDDKALDLAELRRVALIAQAGDHHSPLGMNPDVVLALLDRLEVVEEERDTSDVEVRLLGEACDRLQARAEAAEAKVSSALQLADEAEGIHGDYSVRPHELRAALRSDA